MAMNERGLGRNPKRTQLLHPKHNRFSIGSAQCRRRNLMSKFEKLAAEIRLQIQTGQLKPGERLLSISKLREKHGVSASTIRSVMLVLRAQKLIVGRHGDGV